MEYWSNGVLEKTHSEYVDSNSRLLPLPSFPRTRESRFSAMAPPGYRLEFILSPVEGPV